MKKKSKNQHCPKLPPTHTAATADNYSFLSTSRLKKATYARTALSQWISVPYPGGKRGPLKIFYLSNDKTSHVIDNLGFEPLILWESAIWELSHNPPMKATYEGITPTLKQPMKVYPPHESNL